MSDKSATPGCDHCHDTPESECYHCGASLDTERRLREALAWAMKHVENVFALAGRGEREIPDLERARAVLGFTPAPAPCEHRPGQTCAEGEAPFATSPNTARARLIREVRMDETYRDYAPPPSRCATPYALPDSNACVHCGEDVATHASPPVIPPWGALPGDRAPGGPMSEEAFSRLCGYVMLANDVAHPDHARLVAEAARARASEAALREALEEIACPVEFGRARCKAIALRALGKAGEAK